MDLVATVLVTCFLFSLYPAGSVWSKYVEGQVNDPVQVECCVFLIKISPFVSFYWFASIINISPFLDIIVDMDLSGSILFPFYGGQVLLRRRIRYGMFPTVNVV